MTPPCRTVYGYITGSVLALGSHRRDGQQAHQDHVYQGNSQGAEYSSVTVACRRLSFPKPCGDNGLASAGDVFAFGTENSHPRLFGCTGRAGRDIVQLERPATLGSAIGGGAVVG